MTKKTGNCYYCGEYYERLTRDHILPQSKGGKGLHNNIVLCCSRCNGYKADMLLSDFILYMVHATPNYYIIKNLVDTVISNCLELLGQKQIKQKPPKIAFKDRYNPKAKVPPTAKLPTAKYGVLDNKIKVVAKIDLSEIKVRTKTVKTAKQPKKISKVLISEKHLSALKPKKGIMYIGYFGIESNLVNFHCQ